MAMCEVDADFQESLSNLLSGLLSTPEEINGRLQKVAADCEFTFECRKCNERTLHAVVGFPTEKGVERVFGKYLRPVSDEGSIMLDLLPFQETLFFPTVYFCDGHWVITHYVEDHILYLTDSAAFIDTAINHLHKIQSFSPGQIPIDRIDRLEMYLEDDWLDRMERWLKEQRAVTLDSLSEEVKLVEQLRTERDRLLALMSQEELVLSHGDYQPYNILRLGSDCYVVDWVDCAFRPRYLDIAWLLQALEAVYDLPAEVAWSSWITYKTKLGLGDETDATYHLYRVLSGLKYASNIAGYEHHVLTFVRHFRLMAANWSKFMEV